MDFPSWFQSAIQQRLDVVSARTNCDPELLQVRAEEKKAFEALYGGMDETQFARFMAWEDQHHLKRALENERLYLQGMRDGVQLVMALLADPLPEIK
ncbi:hypothetical protein [Cohnella nanjingensis]|uniref:Uncharacterized protein n=1 Tax=Cohnella nanjingensis TaxID=1387779 RepID=A0A7X0RM82_9BACL|nr:hypothetical protein [Cohnella nanjingensis]MBB6670052.1 hypothetical protein [Cohnella nanjingensis]